MIGRRKKNQIRFHDVSEIEIVCHLRKFFFVSQIIQGNRSSAEKILIHQRNQIIAQ